MGYHSRSRRSRSRGCKYGKLKSPYKKRGVKHVCKKKKKRGKSKRGCRYGRVGGKPKGKCLKKRRKTPLRKKRRHSRSRSRR